MRQKENKERSFARWRKSIILYIKEKLAFIDVKVMAYVLSVVLLVSIIAATVAWFYMGKTTRVMGLYLTSGNSDSIELSLDKTEWNDILEPFLENETTHEYTTTGAVEISMPAFQNIYDNSGNPVSNSNSGILAPGTYGSFEFYVRSVNPDMDACELSVHKILNTTLTGENGAITIESQSMTNEINRLFNGHILCFAQVEGEAAYEYVAADAVIKIPFSDFADDKSEAKKVTIFWVWPYEYKDISGNTIAINSTQYFGTDASPAHMFALPATVENMPENLSAASGKEPEEDYYLSMNQVFEWEQYNKTQKDYLAADERTKKEILSDWYDYADTLIGSYVKNMVFHIEIKGVMADDKE